MAKPIIGIYVTSEEHMDKLIDFCRAAKKKGVETRVFFTHEGTRLCTDRRMTELTKVATVALCKVGFEANRLDRSAALVKEEAFASQSWHAEMIYDCDRYLTF